MAVTSKSVNASRRGAANEYPGNHNSGPPAGPILNVIQTGFDPYWFAKNIGGQQAGLYCIQTMYFTQTPLTHCSTTADLLPGGVPWPNELREIYRVRRRRLCRWRGGKELSVAQGPSCMWEGEVLFWIWFELGLSSAWMDDGRWVEGLKENEGFTESGTSHLARLIYFPRLKLASGVMGSGHRSYEEPVQHFGECCPLHVGGGIKDANDRLRPATSN
ncbi:hypothetical protein B0H14DRAFT_2589998 [Mycena olivaceomarginata]|nr:hypothetical protein B0H14DRAFT_2589998 [Mycena olivaceomarginata]